MQCNLKAMFAGQREAVELPPKPRLGRPPKVRNKEEETVTPDALLEALLSLPGQPEAYDEHLRVRQYKRKADCMVDESIGKCTAALVDVSGKSIGDLRMPGSIARDSSHEGPQVKLKLCKWVAKTLEDIGGGDELLEVIMRAIAERWNLSVRVVKQILEDQAKWQKQCEARGVNENGLLRDEAHLPRYLRKTNRGRGKVTRAKGGGRKDKLRFLYPVVKDFFETMRMHGKYIDSVDLEEYLQHTMARYLDVAANPVVAGAVEGTKIEQRLRFIEAELAKLRNPKTTIFVHQHRQQQLMRFCGARLRTPQRLTVLTMKEEKARWRSTLQAYDRLLWEAVRPEYLRDRVVDPQAFVAGIEDAVVIHADQVPVWLRIGSQRQLYGNLEVKKKKRHETAVPHLSESGAQVVEVHDEDGMAQMRQTAKGEGDRFRVTLELAQVVRNVFKPGEKPEVRHARPVLVVNGAHARLSNIDENGRFVEDEVFLVKNKQKVRKAKMSAGNLMLSWSPATRLS